MVTPRVRWVPPGRRTKLGDEAVELAAESGLVLDEWQEMVVRDSFRRRGDHWAAFEIGLNVPRQNGKGAVLEALMLAWTYLCEDSYIVYSAHLYDTAMEHFRRLKMRIEDCPRLSRELATMSAGRRTSGFKHGHGEEGIEFRGDRRMRFRTRSKGGGRGIPSDKIVWDEAMFAPEFTHGAMLPAVSAMPDSQVVYAGSAVDQQVHEHGVVFTRIRERGLKGGDPSLAYFEWSVDGASPDKVGEDELSDEANWRQANPALGVRIRPEAVAAELRSMAPRTFAVERLGVGDWPRTDFTAEQIVSVDEWRALVDEASVLVPPVCFAFDVSPERRASISAAGRSSGGGYHVEVVDDKDGVSWIVPRLADLVAKHRPHAVVCDGYGPAASVIPKLAAKGVVVETYTASEYAQACGRFVDLVRDKGLAHLGSSELAGAVAASRTRPLGDSWAWSRKNSEGNISPLVSATLAVDAAVVGIGSSVYDSREMIVL